MFICPGWHDLTGLVPPCVTHLFGVAVPVHAPVLIPVAAAANGRRQPPTPIYDNANGELRRHKIKQAEHRPRQKVKTRQQQ